MKKLTSQKHWNDIYLRETGVEIGVWKKILARIKSMLGGKTDNYSEELIWKAIYSKYLPKGKGLKIVEVGSAPGWNLVRFNKEYGYEPYGIEYAEAGVENNRRRFERVGIDPSQVIWKDFFAPDIKEQYSNFFDLAISGGFIEHFDDTQDVIKRHIDLLKTGGILIITIPNFQGVNKSLAKFFDPEVDVTHNFKIMNREAFRDCFRSIGLAETYCDYYGAFYLGMFNPENGRVKNFIYRILVRIQHLFNLFFHLVFRMKHIEHPYTSPYLIYIGKKL